MKRVLASTLFLLGACHIDLDGGTFSVNGRHLDERHEETLEILDWDPDGLVMELSAGDAVVKVTTDGSSRIVATIHEVRLHDGRLEYRDGKLLVETESGEPAVLGDVTVWVDGSLAHLSVVTGAGDVSIRGVPIEGKLLVSTGTGDVSVTGAGRSAVAKISTGLGDIELDAFGCRELTVSTGMGDISLRSVSGDEVEISTGMGDVNLASSSFDRLDASTGMGDIDARGTSYRAGGFDTGMGSVHGGSRLE